MRHSCPSLGCGVLLTASLLLLGCGSPSSGSNATETGGQAGASSGGGSGSGGTSESGGAVGSGGKAGAGGAGGGGGTTSTGGSVGDGGTTSAGGSVGGGGTTSTASGGKVGSGGVMGSGGTSGAGGAAGAGGRTGAGGESGSGGGTASGGATGTGGRSGTGGATSTGGRSGTGGRGAGGAATGGTSGGSGGSTGACPHGQVKANEVLWIGDSWIQIPGTQHNTVRDLARQAGALGASEDYVNKAVSGSPIATIVNQYNTFESGSTKVKVLLMDGGGIDVMQGGKSQASVDNVVAAFKQHLAKVASDGTVQHIVYYLYPQLPASGPGADVGPKLQPGMQAACAASTVPCHFLYLEPLFAGHPEYIGGDNLHPSDAGGKVIGQNVWKIMQENCIAQ